VLFAVSCALQRQHLPLVAAMNLKTHCPQFPQTIPAGSLSLVVI
jgi:hypothetical protein